jgi:hypothetical protein
MPCGASDVGSGRAIESSVPFSSLWSLRLAPSWSSPTGDEAGWHQAWKATAQRVADIGEQALVSGHRVSAREALLRASNYYRTAGDFLLEQPATDPEMTLLSAGQHDTFAAAAALFDGPVQAVSIPYEDTALPAYLFFVDDSGAARPTIIFNSGYDSTGEEPASTDSPA